MGIAEFLGVAAFVVEYAAELGMGFLGEGEAVGILENILADIRHFGRRVFLKFDVEGEEAFEVGMSVDIFLQALVSGNDNHQLPLLYGQA